MPQLSFLGISDATASLSMPQPNSFATGDRWLHVAIFLPRYPRGDTTVAPLIAAANLPHVLLYISVGNSSR